MDIDQVQMQEVTSSNVARVGHDIDSNTLVVEFKRGGSYKISPVTEAGFLSMLSAPSIGKYYHSHIRNNDSLEVEHI